MCKVPANDSSKADIEKNPGPTTQALLARLGEHDDADQDDEDGYLYWDSDTRCFTSLIEEILEMEPTNRVVDQDFVRDYTPLLSVLGAESIVTETHISWRLVANRIDYNLFMAGV